MGAKPQFIQNGKLSGALADPVLLCLEFYRVAEPKPTAAVLLYRDVLVPKNVFNQMQDVHQKALSLLQDIEAVLDDPEHQLIIREAQNLGYSLPNIELFNQELDVYRRAVRGLDVHTALQEGNYVRLPIETARSLNDLMKYNCFMVARIFDDCFNTEYMKHFGFYKNSGLPYLGPNALQSCVNVLLAMSKAINTMENNIRKGTQRADWPEIISSARYKALAHEGAPAIIFPDIPAAE